MYILKEARAKADESISGVGDVATLAYEITIFMLSMWNSKPTDETIGLLTKELVVDPKNSKFIHNLRSSLAATFTIAEIHTACRLAYDEFSSRVIRLHNALQCRENGDIDGYDTAIMPLLSKLGTEIKKEKSSQLIVPGAK